MSVADLTKFPAGTQDKGVNTYEPSIGAEVNWTVDTFNVSGGIRRGVGPRYGMSPIPGHADNEVPATNVLPGLRRSENATNDTRSQGLNRRKKIFKIYQTKLLSSDLSSYEDYLIFIISNELDSVLYIAATMPSTYTGGGFQYYTIQNNYRYGLYAPFIEYQDISPRVLSLMPPLADLTETSLELSLESMLTVSSSVNFISSAFISVSNKKIAMPYLWGEVNADPDATHAPNLAFDIISTGAISTAGDYLGGVPSEYVTSTWRTSQRKLFVRCFDTDFARMDLYYTLDVTPDAAIFVPWNGNVPQQTMLDVDGITATKGGASVAYSSAESAVVYDPQNFLDSAYKAVAVANAGDPKILIYQDWLRDSARRPTQYANPTAHATAPKQYATLGYYAATTETSSFQAFPGYTAGTAIAEAYGIDVTAANQGILRSNTTYELAYSIYNKQFDFETNVGTPVKFRTDTDDFVGLTIWNGTKYASQPNPMALVGAATTLSQLGAITTIFPYTFAGNIAQSMNYAQYRIYYRELYTNEWLPALFIDATDYWFCMSNSVNIVACNGPIAGLPGGTPGGFIDNSPLPRENDYFCTVSWRRRLWWCSPRNLIFSPEDNIFTYPGRNSISTPTGEFLGMITHNRPGEYESASRLLIFGTKENYIARFTGEPSTQPVRVSPDTVGEYPVDGSNLSIDVWTTVPAFSYRSAVNADGVVYYWGPEGVYRDNGTQLPTKISLVLEPNIFTLYDPGETREIHCTFVQASKEIVWFYTPKEADGDHPTHGLVYNVENGKFYFEKFTFKVDDAFDLNLSADDKISGQRTIVTGRVDDDSTIQRAYFFDPRCQAGDFPPDTELMVKTISTPSTGLRRLTLAAGYPSLASLAVNDYISLSNVLQYATTLTDADNMIAKIAAINSGSGLIDITLPEGATLDGSASLTQQNYFPIYYGGDLTAANPGFHGISYQVDTEYWLPEGLSNSWFWIHLYFLFRYVGIPTPPNPFTGTDEGTSINLAYRSLVSSGSITDVLKLRNNSADHCQILHPLRNVDKATGVSRAANGQALKYTLSGIHIGNPWTLEYLEAHCKKETGFTLKEFEG